MTAIVIGDLAQRPQQIATLRKMGVIWKQICWLFGVDLREAKKLYRQSVTGFRTPPAGTPIQPGEIAVEADETTLVVWPPQYAGVLTA